MSLPGLESITLSRWVYRRLTQDAALAAALGTTLAALADRVWEGTAPEGTPGPWVTFTILPPVDVKGVGMVQVMSMVEVQVKVTTTGTSYTPLVDPYRRAHTLLEAQTHQEVQDGGAVLTCHRVSGIQYPERAAGVEYRHLGGLYRTETQ